MNRQVARIDRIASREWAVAVFVHGECLKDAGDKHLPEFTERSATAEPVARILETLEGLSVTLLRLIDARLRSESPPLYIWQADDIVYARWEGGPAEIKLSPFVRLQAMRFGEFHHDAATIVANKISILLASGGLRLPGFDLEKPTIVTSQTVIEASKGRFQVMRPVAAGVGAR